MSEQPSLQDRALDAVYVSVGLGVLAYQRYRTRQRELREQLDAVLRQLGGA